MAWTASGMFGLTLEEMLEEVINVDLDLTTHKVYMTTNSDTPNFDTDAAYSSTNEVTDGLSVYVAGGKDLTGLAPAVTIASGVLKYDMGDISWANCSITSARGSKLYADALAGNDLIVAHNFGSDFTATNGTFTIQWHANGVFTIDYTP